MKKISGIAITALLFLISGLVLAITGLSEYRYSFSEQTWSAVEENPMLARGIGAVFILISAGLFLFRKRLEELESKNDETQ